MFEEVEPGREGAISAEWVHYRDDRRLMLDFPLDLGRRVVERVSVTGIDKLKRLCLTVQFGSATDKRHIKGKHVAFLTQLGRRNRSTRGCWVRRITIPYSDTCLQDFGKQLNCIPSFGIGFMQIVKETRDHDADTVELALRVPCATTGIPGLTREERQQLRDRREA